MGQSESFFFTWKLFQFPFFSVVNFYSFASVCGFILALLLRACTILFVATLTENKILYCVLDVTMLFLAFDFIPLLLKLINACYISGKRTNVMHKENLKLPN
jgi:hypothetical protein